MMQRELQTKPATPVTIQRKAMPEQTVVTSRFQPLRTLGNARYQNLVAGPVVQRDCGCGGTCASCSGGRDPDEASILQPSLTVGPANDAYEREADAVADAVMRMPEPDTVRRQPVEEEEELLQPKLQRQPIEEEEEVLQPKPLADGITPLVQRVGQAAGAMAAPPEVDAVLAGTGQPLDGATRAFMEPRLGYDFGGVRVHTGSMARASSQAVQAKAYTVGRDIVFNTGQYQPGSDAGRKLLAHELTHVVQQTGGSSDKDAAP